jgi:hypothetical protein
MTNEQGERLLFWLQTTIRLEGMSDVELGDLLTDHVWATLPLGSPQSDLIAEVIARLKGERHNPA